MHPVTDDSSNIRIAACHCTFDKIRVRDKSSEIPSEYVRGGASDGDLQYVLCTLTYRHRSDDWGEEGEEDEGEEEKKEKTEKEKSEKEEEKDEGEVSHHTTTNSPLTTHSFVISQ